MSLTKYNPQLTLPAFGLKNSGAICYFNSMIQCFLSCTSVLTVFDNNPDGLRTRNELCMAVWHLIQLARGRDPKVSEMSCVIWEALRRQMRIMRIAPFGNGMEDAHEGFVKFLDAFDAPEIQELFEHRYKTSIQCSKCQVKRDVEKHDTGIFCKFQLEDFQRDGDLQNMILQREEPIDEFTCKACGVKCAHTRTDRFLFTPEVIICWFSKFAMNKTRTRAVYKSWAANAPDKIVIPGHGVSEIGYRMVAISEHSGDMDGGHYWAHAQRADHGGQNNNFAMQRLDDTRVGPGAATGTTMSSYMVWYHAV